MINAPMMPGTQPRMVSTVTITMDPQPLSRTASGGKRMQSTTRQQLIVLSCYSRNVILPLIRNDIRKPSPNGKGFQPFSLPLYSRLYSPHNANKEKKFYRLSWRRLTVFRPPPEGWIQSRQDNRTGDRRGIFTFSSFAGLHLKRSSERC